MDHSTKTKNYYENNTRRFLWFQRDAATKSIHQPLWKEPSFTLEEAYSYANQLVLEQINTYSKDTPISIMDLGCGVGSSIFYLLEQNQKPANYYGVTISATQIAIAKNRLQSEYTNKISPSSIHFIEADFSNLPADIPKVHLIFSIEAFAHAATAEQYFKQCSEKLHKGGKIMLIDDFLSNTIAVETLDSKSQQAIADFKYGWLVNSLKTPKELATITAKYDLKIIEEVDLTPLMRNNTLKHKWIWLLVVSFRWLYNLLPQKSYYFRSWIGGKGKQYGLKKGILKYKKIVLEKI